MILGRRSAPCLLAGAAARGLQTPAALRCRGAPADFAKLIAEETEK